VPVETGLPAGELLNAGTRGRGLSVVGADGSWSDPPGPAVVAEGQRRGLVGQFGELVFDYLGLIDAIADPSRSPDRKADGLNPGAHGRTSCFSTPR
jgi:hypothetical protein